jgi:MFS family permease
MIDGLLGRTTFRRYFLAQTLSVFGDRLVPLALAFAVLAITDSLTALGLVLLASRLPVILFALLGGAAGDRYDRRTVMIAADVVRFGCQAATAALLLSGHAEVWSLMVLQSVAGAATAFFTPAATGMVAALVPSAELRRANALLSVSMNTGAIVALGISGALVALVGPGWAFALDALTFAASAFFLIGLKVTAALTPVGERTGLLRRVGAGWSAVASRPWLWSATAHLALLNGLVIAPTIVLGPFVAERDLGGATSWAAIGIGAALGGLAGAGIALRWHPRRPLAAAFGCVFAVTPLLVLLAVPGPVWALVLAAGAASMQTSIFNVFLTSTVQAHIPAALLARVSSVTMVGSLAALPVGMALVGPLAGLVGSRTVLLAAATWAVLSTAAVLTLPSVRRLTDPSPRFEDPEDREDPEVSGDSDDRESGQNRLDHDDREPAA